MTRGAFLREVREQQRADAERRTAAACAKCRHAPAGALCLACATRLVLRAEQAERDAMLGTFGRHRKVTGPSGPCARCDGWGWWVKDSPLEDYPMIECLVCDGTGHGPGEAA